MIDYSEIKLIVFDADDTLWDCQSHFDTVMKQTAEILKEYATLEHIEEQLYNTERANMPLMGYGTKAFTISLIENSIKASNYRATPDELLRILSLGKGLLSLPATPLDGVVDTLTKLQNTNRYHMIMFTKGESLDQKGKIERSGLSTFFSDIIIVDDKTEEEYKQICNNNNVSPGEMIMVGNSFKSDIAPALNIGANAAYIPFHVTWALEHSETFEHERLVTLETIADLCTLLS